VSNYLTIKETAAYLNVTVRCIRSWIELKKIEHVKFPKEVRFRKEYLDKWIEKRTVKAKKEPRSFDRGKPVPPIPV
jgi:excisionase family DNA binding protein